MLWSCERFHVYFKGSTSTSRRQFELWTDLKPIECVYSARSRPSARIERWVLRLQSYSFTVKFMPRHLNVADSLSRLTKIGEMKFRSIAEDCVSFVAKTAIPRAMNSREIEEASSFDEELMTVRQCIEIGNWDSPKCVSCKSVRDELCIVGKIVLRGTRMVIPQKLDQE